MAADSRASHKTEETAVPQATTTDGQRKTKVAILAAPVATTGFVNFLREHAIVSLAVGFVLGTQVQTVVKQLISSFIDPFFQILFPGNKTLSARTFTLHFGSRHANFGWGAVAYDFVDFLFVALAIYFVIKLFKLDKLDKPKS